MKVFFDVDGVLIDGWHAKPERRRPWHSNMLSDLGIDPNRFHQGFFATPTNEYPSVMHGCVIGKYDLKEALGAFLPTIGYRGPVENVVRYWFEHDSHLNQAVWDAIKHLSDRRELDLYLATAQEHYRAAYLWTELDFKCYFKDIFYGAKLGEPKSSIAFFQKISKALAMSAEDCPLFFDDQEEVVAVAREAGWDAYVLDHADDIRHHPRLRGFFGN